MSLIWSNPDLLKDAEMEEKLYNEADIAEHTILLTGFPKDIPKQELEQKVREIMIELLKIDKITDES